ncbi:hypothetical protein QFZ80_001591 [Paenibacillus sp. V4I7]|nr:hypothetical protein [Paenibacillus sp. V4I7]MDQ0916245.1 hypothetical protein [Paenibacillus sp. V4I5]
MQLNTYKIYGNLVSYGGIMFELQTYLAKPPKLLEIEFGSDLAEVYKYQREKLYIAMNDAEN